MDCPPTPALPPAPAQTEPVPTASAVTRAAPSDDESTATGPIAFAGATLARFRQRRPRKQTDTGPELTIRSNLAVVPDPEPEVPAIVMGEENKLRQVVTNLVGNALRFTPDDSPLEIGVSEDLKTRTATIAVIDHGRVVAEGTGDELKASIGSSSLQLRLTDALRLDAARAIVRNTLGVDAVASP